LLLQLHFQLLDRRYDQRPPATVPLAACASSAPPGLLTLRVTRMSTGVAGCP
jgi:hypothetical protein